MKPVPEREVWERFTVTFWVEGGEGGDPHVYEAHREEMMAALRRMVDALPPGSAGRLEDESEGYDDIEQTA